jgi:hypothetical protein
MNMLQEFQFRVEHQHNDGTWGELAEDHSHHDVAAHDAERGWIQRVFRCDCGENVSVTTREKASPPDAE